MINVHFLCSCLHAPFFHFGKPLWKSFMSGIGFWGEVQQEWAI